MKSCIFCFVLVFCFVCANSRSDVVSYTVSGQILTSSDVSKGLGSKQPVRCVEVHVVDDNVLVDDLIKTFYTDEEGRFSETFEWEEDGFGLSIDVVGRGTLIDGQLVNLYQNGFHALFGNEIEYEGTGHMK